MILDTASDQIGPRMAKESHTQRVVQCKTCAGKIASACEAAIKRMIAVVVSFGLNDKTLHSLLL